MYHLIGRDQAAWEQWAGETNNDQGQKVIKEEFCNSS